MRWKAKYPQNPVGPIVHIFLDIRMPEINLRLRQLRVLEDVKESPTSEPTK